MTENELKFWAEAHAQAGSAVAKAVLCLFEKLSSQEPTGVYRCGCPVKRSDNIKAFCDKHHDMIDTGPVPDRAPVSGEEMVRLIEERRKRAWPEIREAVFGDVLQAFDGSTGTPQHGQAGYVAPPPPGSNQ